MIGAAIIGGGNCNISGSVYIFGTNGRVTADRTTAHLPSSCGYVSRAFCSAFYQNDRHDLSPCKKQAS